MADETWTAVDRYFADLLVGPDATLEAALTASAAAGLPDHAVSPGQGKLLWLLARMQGANRILEIGTLGGYSTIWLARALPERGTVVTLEADATHARVARENVERAGLGERVDIRLGSALDTLPQLLDEGLGPFDLVFIDADKPNNPDYLEWGLRLSRRGSVIVADNVVRDGGVIDAASDDGSVRGIRRFAELVGAEPRLSATVIQTVGSKGYDGFLVALFTGEAGPA